MQGVIDCNQNLAIDTNLWMVYDYLCERTVAVKQVKMDLESKKKLLEAEKERCEKRGTLLTEDRFEGGRSKIYESLFLPICYLLYNSIIIFTLLPRLGWFRSMLEPWMKKY